MRTPHYRFGVLGFALAATMLGVACRRAEVPPPAVSTVTATQTAATPSAQSATPAASPEKEVERAYLAYWDAYAAAVLNLDATQVEGFAAGADRDAIGEEIEKLRADAVAVRVVVKHDPLIVMTSESTATVVDQITNNSFYVDPVTKAPPHADGSGNVLRDTYFLEKVAGRWVVVRGSRDRRP